MGVVQNLIIVEDVFDKIFSYLPEMRFDESDPNLPSYKVRFSYGDEKELIAFLNSTENEDLEPYPLIWLVYPNEEKHLKTKVELKNVNLIVAVDNSELGQLYKERMELSYKNIIMPLCNNIVKLLTRANIINIKHEFNITKFPNYGIENGHIADTPWDAARIKFSCSILDTCLKPIKI